MCTIALLAGPPGHLILAGNRDESRLRPAAIAPSIHALPESPRLALYPVDAAALGTWIGVNDAGLAITLLNNYQRSAVFDTRGAPRSRGLIIPELLRLDALDEVTDHLQHRWHPDHAADTFPFTLIAAESRSPQSALRCDWDGRSLRLITLRPPLMLASSGYDLEGVTRARHDALSELLEVEDFTRHPRLGEDPGSITEWFAHGGPSPHPYSVSMSRPDAHTVSHTRVILSPDCATMTYLGAAPWRHDAHLTQLSLPLVS